MINVFVRFGKKAFKLLRAVLSVIVLLLSSAAIFCGFVATTAIATPIAVVEALFLYVWACLSPVSAAKCWNRWRNRCGCKGMVDAIFYYLDNYDFDWHYPIAREVFLFLTQWVKSAKFSLNPYFVEETELCIWPAENQIRWYEELHKDEAKALNKLSVSAFMKMWKKHCAEYNLEQFKLMRSKLPEEALLEILEYRMQYEDVNWSLVSEWFMCQCRSSKAVNALIIYALCKGESHQSAKIAEMVVQRNGLPQMVIADLLEKKDNVVANRLIEANTNYEYIVALKSSASCNLTGILESCKKMNPKFDGFDSEVEMYLNEETYKTYHNCGYHLKTETIQKMLSSDNMSLPLLKMVIANEPMFKDLASLDEDVKTLLKSKMKYLARLF